MADPEMSLTMAFEQVLLSPEELLTRSRANKSLYLPKGTKLRSVLEDGYMEASLGLREGCVVMLLRLEYEGDAVLAPSVLNELRLQVAHRLQTVMSGRGAAGYLEEDDFVLVGTQGTLPVQALELAEEVQHSVRAPMVIDGQPFRVHGHVGVTFHEEERRGASKLVARAFRAMSRSWSRESKGVAFSDPARDPRN
mgnify:CR=1 FL=1